MQIPVFDVTGKKSADSWSVETKVLGTANEALLLQAARVYEDNAHQKTHKVKTRGEVDGSTRKIYRQKGTGNARHGARYAPIFVVEGIAHGPSGVRPDNLVLPKAMRRRALAAALVEKFSEKAVSGVTGVKDADGKTSTAVKLLATVAGHPKTKVLVVTSGRAEKLYLAVRSVQGAAMKRASLVNAYDLLAAGHVIVTKKALDEFVARVKAK